jgi:hypothetical protein
MFETVRRNEAPPESPLRFSAAKSLTEELAVKAGSVTDQKLRPVNGGIGFRGASLRLSV